MRYKTEIKWAILFIVTSLLWMVLEKISGLHDTYLHLQQYITVLFAIPAVWIYVVALREKKRLFYHGSMTFTQGFVSGLIMTLIITVCSPLTQWITSTIITPDYFKNVIDYSVKTGYYSSVEEATAYFNLRNYIVESTIFAFGMGLITTAVVAFFLKTRRPTPSAKSSI